MEMDDIGSVDVISILEDFQDLDDPRSTINRKHLLGDLIVISILAVIAGADGPQAIGVWADSHAEWLRRHLELPNGIPSHDTIGRLLAALKPAAFQNCFEQWILRLRGGEDASTEAGDEIIAIDGKWHIRRGGALRRSHDRRRGLGPLFLVSAWSVRRGISLGRLAAADKSNEITAIPELVEQIDVTDAIVTIDAAGCQKGIAAKIIKGGGDYVLALKGNQRTLHRAVVDYFHVQIENDFEGVAVRTRQEVVKGHGRVDTLYYYQLPAPASLPDRKSWQGPRTIGLAIRSSQQNGRETSGVRYYISSLRPGVRRFAESVRGHWRIENTWHWCLDVTFREDESRLRDRHAADNLAWLKRFAISLLKQPTDKESIAIFQSNRATPHGRLEH